jgi:thiamine biosynthesis lipoprotein
MTAEAHASFACFGSTCSVHVGGDGSAVGAPRAVAAARRRLLAWHARFTRFSAVSELSLLNADPRVEVPASPIMRRFAAAVLDAARLTAGLVDATLLPQLESAGYTGDLGKPAPLRAALALAPPRHPAGPRPGSPWRALSVSPASIRRPPGLLLDSGGLAKGLFADVLGERLRDHASYAVECAGDLRVGGAPRPVHVTSPFDGELIHTFELAGAGVATSGIGRRSWLDEHGRPAHHLLDPATGAPAFTGVVQATAVAPTALEAEMRAKAAVLAGPEGAEAWLPHGGVLVLDDAGVRVVEPEEPASIPADRLPASQSGTGPLEPPGSRLSWRR